MQQQLADVHHSNPEIGETDLKALCLSSTHAGVSGGMRSSKVPDVTCSKPMLVDEDPSTGDCLASIACLCGV